MADAILRFSVLLSAHTNAQALRWVLLSYARQTQLPHEIVVAQDSDAPDVAAVVKDAQEQAPYAIHLQQQENRGFRKCLAMNRAIAASTGDYLIFSDGDCIARNDVLAAYARYARRGEFLSGGSHINLPTSFHRDTLAPSHITSQVVFTPAFLQSLGVRFGTFRLTPHHGLQRLMNALTARNAFSGAHAGAWRDDVLRVAGFDEEMAYGAEDRNLGIRLNAIGVKGRRIRHSLAWLHLDHPRSYAHAESIAKNKAWNAEIQGTKTFLPRKSMLMPD